ncbi:phosphate regulon sensor histidine kinase PhoR [Candidatus Albibeggiatoa sp. nov. NOAA]|uniref:phosphate regulon sensor histidine kinase PhoR n=1 Tax=Candidatus Albibeggiatoa sp. nov. NOAA TaxID=3162724 RepID=UPI0032F7E4F2|nr:phosphate regulon sensor histidine kinase PhoR [Thiotrichaceae bacterium]
MNYWQQEVKQLVILIILMSILGVLTGQPLLFLALTCLSYSIWHLYNLYHLDQWFRNRRKFELPNSHGIWGEVFYNFYRLQQRNRKRKRKIATLLKRFRRSTTAMPDAVVVLGPNHEIEWVNKAARQLLGLRSSRDKGQCITNLIRQPLFVQYLNNINKKESIKLNAPTNPEVMLRINIVPYAKNRYLLLARDITQIHRLEQVRQDFVANVSHELRTPLTVIGGFLETMQDDESFNNTEWERPLLLMSQQTSRMQNIVDDLLLLSRLESEATSDTSEPIDIANLLAMICDEAKALSAGRHQINLEIKSLTSINGHPKELRSVFSNLVFNAVNYTPEGSEVLIQWFEGEEHLHFVVHDTGDGIAPEHLPRLTERFYRVDVGRSRSQGGTGLGLAIVKHVLHRHAAKLRIESVVGEGSHFWCDFPKKLIDTSIVESS